VPTLNAELKNALLFNNCQVPHFNYVGDSILGHKAHLGAGVVLSNFKSFKGNVTVEVDGVPQDTGLRKFGVSTLVTASASQRDEA